jgi:hypothetical protein
MRNDEVRLGPVSQFKVGDIISLYMSHPSVKPPIDKPYWSEPLRIIGQYNTGAFGFFTYVVTLEGERQTLTSDRCVLGYAGSDEKWEAEQAMHAMRRKRE